MARGRLFTPAQETEIAQRMAAGESTPSIAKSLGTSHQNVQNAAKRVATESQSGASDLGPPRDEFEVAQMAAFKVLETRIQSTETSARDLAGLVKAQNDTIKAIRQHRLLSRVGAGDDRDDRVHEDVVAKLKRLVRHTDSMPAAVAIVSENEEPTGTE